MGAQEILEDHARLVTFCACLSLHGSSARGPSFCFQTCALGSAVGTESICEQLDEKCDELFTIGVLRGEVFQEQGEPWTVLCLPLCGSHTVPIGQGCLLDEAAEDIERGGNYQ